MNLATAVRQAVAGSLATSLNDIPPSPMIDRIAQDTVILAANRLEAIDSPLCDCGRGQGEPPRNWKTREFIDHHCDCKAVAAAGHLLEGTTSTLHAEQCPGCRT